MVHIKLMPKEAQAVNTKQSLIWWAEVKRHVINFSVVFCCMIMIMSAYKAQWLKVTFFLVQLTELFRQDVGHSNSAEDARPEVQAKAARRAETIQGSRCMPIDWTLKTKMRISSSQAFQCCQAALTAHCTNGKSLQLRSDTKYQCFDGTCETN